MFYNAQFYRNVMRYYVNIKVNNSFMFDTDIIVTMIFLLSMINNSDAICLTNNEKTILAKYYSAMITNLSMRLSY